MARRRASVCSCSHADRDHCHRRPDDPGDARRRRPGARPQRLYHCRPARRRRRRDAGANQKPRPPDRPRDRAGPSRHAVGQPLDDPATPTADWSTSSPPSPPKRRRDTASNLHPLRGAAHHGRHRARPRFITSASFFCRVVVPPAGPRALARLRRRLSQPAAGTPSSGQDDLHWFWPAMFPSAEYAPLPSPLL
jgi:hypothetical protein